jgi:hypothetical protein
MYPGVRSVEAATEYRLIIGFDNGEHRVFNARPLLTMGRFQALASPQVFARVRVAFDTIEWENGLDLDPEYLYERSEPMDCEQAAAADPAKRGAAEGKRTSAPEPLEEAAGGADEPGLG